MVERQSSDKRGFFMRDFLQEREARKIALWVIDLSGGGTISPLIFFLVEIKEEISAVFKFTILNPNFKPAWGFLKEELFLLF